MKSMNWISGTGRIPYRAIPIAVPMIPPSDRGVSNTRSGNSSMSPSVQRNTPPFLPTSSPRITTRSSRRISSRRALFTACTIVITGISGLAPHPFRVRVVALLRPFHDSKEPRVLEQGSELGLGFSLFAILLGLRARLLRRLHVPEVREVEREGHPRLRVVRVGVHRLPVERDRLVVVAEEGVALGHEDQGVRVLRVPGRDLVEHRDGRPVVAVPEGTVRLLEAPVRRGIAGRRFHGGSLRGHLIPPGPASGPRAAPRGAAASPRTRR